MWRYGIGKEPPSKKTRCGNETKTAKDIGYDAEKRKRTFQASWLQKFDWLQYDEVGEIMFCRDCKLSPLADIQSIFVRGSKNFKIDPIKAHDVSACHKCVIEKKKAEIQQPGSSLASKALSSLQKVQVQRLEKLFRTAHALVKNCRPFTDFTWQCKLDLKKDVDIGQTYHNDKACKEFAKFISLATLQELVNDINEAKCFSIMCDESTDSSILEELIIYVVFSIKGKVSTKFLCIKSLNKPDADSIYSTIREACISQLKLEATAPFRKLVSFTADGAATMQGNKNGVGKKLIKEQPNLIKLHCMAHRLELAFKGTVKEFQEYKKVDDFLLTVYLFYHNSPSNRAQLKESCESMNCRSLIPTRVGGTRWLSHMQKAFLNFWCIYEPIAIQLENVSVSSKTDSSLKAKGILKVMTNESFIRSALELNAVVAILQKVSLSLQEQTVTLFHAKQSISAAKEALQDLKDSTDIEIKLKEAAFKNRVKIIDSRNKGKNKFNEFIDNILQKISTRFPAEEHEGLVSCMKLLSLEEWPAVNNPEFGKQEIKQLIKEQDLLLQSLGINTSSLSVDWICLRNSLYAKNTVIKNLNWETVNYENYLGHENILDLVDILLSIPCTSTECERGFSKMKAVKTDWRSSLRPDTLTDLMRVTLNTENIEDFNPTQSISLWLESGSYRKLETTPYKIKATSDIASDIEASMSSDDDE